MVTAPRFESRQFLPAPGMENRHVMTIFASRWWRKFPDLLAFQEERVVRVSDDASVLLECNFAGPAPARGPIAIILHGLEGSSRSHYLLGLAEKLCEIGISAARMNMRNCGGTMHLSSSLYNAGLSGDVCVAAESFLKEGFDSVFFVGFSLGGNVVLKAASELSKKPHDWLKGVVAVSPSLDLSACVDAIEKGFNRVYEINFLRSLKSKIREKSGLKQGDYDLRLLGKIKSLRQFDDAFTAPDGGYGSADEYYRCASALPMVSLIDVPALIISAQDDPIVPFSSLAPLLAESGMVELLAPKFGGHAGFVGALQQKSGGTASFGRACAKDRFWAESTCCDFLVPLAYPG
jgi:hypothetical protein